MVGENLTKGGRRREQILSAAVELFGEVGYRGTSLRDIAQKVGITHPGLLYHFHSKQELLSAVLARRDATDEASFSLDGSKEGREYLEHILKVAENNAIAPGMVELFATLSAESTDPEHPAHEYFKDRYSKIVKNLEMLFEFLAKDGELPPEVDPRQLAVNTVALMDGLQVQWLYAPNQIRVSDQLKNFLNSYLKSPL